MRLVFPYNMGSLFMSGRHRFGLRYQQSCFDHIVWGKCTGKWSPYLLFCSPILIGLPRWSYILQQHLSYSYWKVDPWVERFCSPMRLLQMRDNWEYCISCFMLHEVLCKLMSLMIHHAAVPLFCVGQLSCCWASPLSCCRLPTTVRCMANDIATQQTTILTLGFLRTITGGGSQYRVFLAV